MFDLQFALLLLLLIFKRKTLVHQVGTGYHYLIAIYCFINLAQIKETWIVYASQLKKFTLIAWDTLLNRYKITRRKLYFDIITSELLF